ncbi:unnamed protein product [Periconia digitata]|uniref:Gfd2/YDR514C-like C-terminal domain-containing protein n=1 Tax=Periconia digitata TaxID=1303443 RepID=A0A9W4UUV0_9PLEO|nr:unnamed protein product [Periconia digitata]
MSPSFRTPRNHITPSSSRASSSPTDGIKQVASYLNNLSDLQVMQLAVGRKVGYIPAPEYLKNLVVVCLDAEHFAHPPRMLTELGFATYYLSDVRQVCKDPGPHGEEILKTIYPYHYRMIESAQFINHAFLHGDPEMSRFGETRFVTKDEMSRVLDIIFVNPVDPNDLSRGYCPVLCLGHAIKGDLKMLEDEFDFKWKDYGTIVRTLDTQVFAREKGLSQKQISLKNLCTACGFTAVNSHTALNDAMYTLIAAVQMALTRDHDMNATRPDTDSKPSGKSLNRVIKNLIDPSREVSLGVGIKKYCTACGRYNHRKPACTAPKECAICLKAERFDFMKSHITQLCPMWYRET